MEGDLHIILNVFSSLNEVKLNSKMEYVKDIDSKTKLRYDKLHIATHICMSQFHSVFTQWPAAK